MEVIHSLGATSFNQQGRSGAVDNFLTFHFLARIFQVKGGLIFSGLWGPLRFAEDRRDFLPNDQGESSFNFFLMEPPFKLMR